MTSATGHTWPAVFLKETKMNTETNVLQARARHHRALEALAKNLNPKQKRGGLALWRALRRIEEPVHKAAEDYCNGIIDRDAMDRASERATGQVQRLFGVLPPRFHVNRDPRGHALKLLSNDNGTEAATPFALEQDWGRNQILAPEINA